MISIAPDLDKLDAQALRELAAGLMVKLDQKDQELVYRQTKIDQLTHEMAMLKRYQFGRRSEQMDKQPETLGSAHALPR